MAGIPTDDNIRGWRQGNTTANILSKRHDWAWYYDAENQGWPVVIKNIEALS